VAVTLIVLLEVGVSMEEREALEDSVRLPDEEGLDCAEKEADTLGQLVSEADRVPVAESEGL